MHCVHASLVAALGPAKPAAALAAAAAAVALAATALALAAAAVALAAAAVALAATAISVAAAAVSVIAAATTAPLPPAIPRPVRLHAAAREPRRTPTHNSRFRWCAAPNSAQSLSTWRQSYGQLRSSACTLL